MLFLACALHYISLDNVSIHLEVKYFAARCVYVTSQNHLGMSSCGISYLVVTYFNLLKV